MASQLPENFRELLNSITSKRPKTVIDHILQHGYITTEELQNTYGYEHPPRAARDVRELGVPLETFDVVNAQGKRIAAYRFGDLTKARAGVLKGRKIFSKDFKGQIAAKDGQRCAICLTKMELRYLQVDHRVPYEVGGEGQGTRVIGDHMLLCGSCNRAKSWSCEHCENWLSKHDPNICKSCYWASPESYEHVAMRTIRRLDVTWEQSEVKDYDKIAGLAKSKNLTVADLVKAIIKNQKQS